MSSAAWVEGQSPAERVIRMREALDVLRAEGVPESFLAGALTYVAAFDAVGRSVTPAAPLKSGLGG